MIRRLAALLALSALILVGTATAASAQLGDLADQVEPPGGAEPAHHWECEADEDLPEPVFGTILNEAELVQLLVELEAGQPLPVNISEELAEQLGCTEREDSWTPVTFEETGEELEMDGSDELAAGPVGTEPGAMLPATGLGSGLALAGLLLTGSAVGLRRLLGSITA